MNGVEEAYPYIEELIRQTMDGKIQWQRRSASTFSWGKKKKQEALQISLQRTRSPRRREYTYILQLSDMRTNNILFTVDSSENEEMSHPLEHLFDVVERTTIERGLSAFQRLLEDE